MHSKQLYPVNILDMFPVGAKYQLMVKQQGSAERMFLADKCAAANMDCGGSK